MTFYFYQNSVLVLVLLCPKKHKPWIEVIRRLLVFTYVYINFSSLEMISSRFPKTKETQRRHWKYEIIVYLSQNIIVVFAWHLFKLNRLQVQETERCWQQVNDKLATRKRRKLVLQKALKRARRRVLKLTKMKRSIEGRKMHTKNAITDRKKKYAHCGQFKTDVLKKTLHSTNACICLLVVHCRAGGLKSPKLQEIKKL